MQKKMIFGAEKNDFQCRIYCTTIPHPVRTLTPNYDFAVTGRRLFVDTAMILKRNFKLATHQYVVNMLSMLLYLSIHI